MKYIYTLLLMIATLQLGMSQRIMITIENLGEIETGFQSILVSYTAVEGAFIADDGSDDWGSQTITFGWSQSSGVKAEQPNSNIQFVPGNSFPFKDRFTNSANIITYTLDQVGGTDNGNVYMTLSAPETADIPIALGVKIDIFTLKLPIDIKEQAVFRAGEDFFLNTSDLGLSFGTTPNISNIILGNSWDLGEAGAFLPVEFSFFTAVKNNSNSILKWETELEINNDFFNVERSADGKSFSTIGKVLGNGTTTETQNYEFIDRTPVAGLNYYRLKQVDFNGDYEYSKVETVDFRTGNEGDIKVFPNPTVDYVNIHLDRTYEGVKITNQLGQLIENLPASSFENNYIKLNVAGYTPGVYYIEAKLNHEVVNKQFVKLK